MRIIQYQYQCKMVNANIKLATKLQNISMKNQIYTKHQNKIRSQCVSLFAIYQQSEFLLFHFLFPLPFPFRFGLFCFFVNRVLFVSFVIYTTIKCLWIMWKSMQLSTYQDKKIVYSILENKCVINICNYCRTEQQHQQSNHVTSF